MHLVTPRLCQILSLEVRGLGSRVGNPMQTELMQVRSKRVLRVDPMPWGSLASLLLTSLMAPDMYATLCTTDPKLSIFNGNRAAKQTLPGWDGINAMSDTRAILLTSSWLAPVTSLLSFLLLFTEVTPRSQGSRRIGS